MTSSQAGSPLSGPGEVTQSLVDSLREELTRAPGRLCLVVGEPAPSRQLVETFAKGDGVEALSIGRLVTVSENQNPFEDLQGLVGDAGFLVDLDILFWPEARSNALQLLRSLSRTAPRIAQWPGNLIGKRLTYSEPGRRDFFDATIDDAVIVRPIVVRFPDEIPYQVERIPA